MRVRLAAGVAGLLLGGPACTASAQVQNEPPGMIEVVYTPDIMFYSIRDGGAARFRVSEREDYSFTTSHEEYDRLAQLLEPLREGGNPCLKPTSSSPPGYIRWTHGAEVHEVPLAVGGCSEYAFAGRYAHDSGAFRAVYELAENAPQRPRPALPAPSQIKLVWMTWGNIREEWTVPAGGTAHWREPPDRSKDFAVSPADFEYVRDQFRAFEGMAFRCERAIYDMPYGRVVWSQPGHVDQTLEFDLGCVTGDADTVLESVEKATAVLVELRDRGH